MEERSLLGHFLCVNWCVCWQWGDTASSALPGKGLYLQFRGVILVLSSSDCLCTCFQAGAEGHVVPEVKVAISLWLGPGFCDTSLTPDHPFGLLWTHHSAILQCFHCLHWSCSCLPSPKGRGLSGTKVAQGHRVCCRILRTGQHDQNPFRL